MDGCGPHCGHHKDIIELQQLRDLIAAWADAEDGADIYWTDEYAQASDALRKAVEQ
jgi:hypothetical protein